MRFQLKTMLLVLCVALAVLGWWVDRQRQAKLFESQRKALEQEAVALREEIAVRDLNARVLHAIVAARSAKSQVEFEQAVRDVQGAMDSLIGHGARGKIAIRSYVDSVKVPWWSGSEWQFDMLSPFALAAVGPECLPDTLKLLHDKDPRVRQLAAQSLQIMIHPNYAEHQKLKLSEEESQRLVEPIQAAAAAEKDWQTRVRLNRIIAWLVRKERNYIE